LRGRVWEQAQKAELGHKKIGIWKWESSATRARFEERGTGGTITGLGLKALGSFCQKNRLCEGDHETKSKKGAEGAQGPVGNTEKSCTYVESGVTQNLTNRPGKTNIRGWGYTGTERRSILRKKKVHLYSESGERRSNIIKLVGGI